MCVLASARPPPPTPEPDPTQSRGAVTRQPLPIWPQVAKGFFWQTPGAMLPYIVGLLVLAATGHTHDDPTERGAVSLQFRLARRSGAPTQRD